MKVTIEDKTGKIVATFGWISIIALYFILSFLNGVGKALAERFIQ